jgi:DNA repair photolyase
MLDEDDSPDPQARTKVYRDKSRSLINHVDRKNSPDIPYDWTISPYRGCEHGCIYCYARPYHEYLGFSSGIDFETRIMAKPDAPAMLRDELAAPRWTGETIVMSGITDVYQPIEEKLKITRGCLEVMAQCRQPVGIITRSRRILRDLDLIAQLAAHKAVHVAISLTTLDATLAAKMEPRASSPGDRLTAIRELSKAGVPVTVMTAPIIPAINDREIPALLEAAREAGAVSAGYTLLRLPWQIKALFLEWVRRHFPDRADHVESLIRGAHHGKLYDATHFTRRRGEGPFADQIKNVFTVFARRHGLNQERHPLSSAAFRKPSKGGQMGLFG